MAASMFQAGVTIMEGISGWWNSTSLEPPPFLVYPTKKKIVRQSLRKLMDKQMNLPAKKHFHAEIAIMKRLLFKMNSQFRRSKKFHAMQRLRVCFDKFELLNIPKTYENFSTSIPNENGDMTLGSRQMLEFVLAKTVCAVHLLSQACDHCFSAIEVLSAFLTFEMVELYNKLYQQLRFLRASPVPWIPGEEKLPESLTEFKTFGSLKHIPESSRSNTRDISSYFTKTFENIPKSDPEPETKQFFQIDKVNMQIEIGTLVSRSQYAAGKPDIASFRTICIITSKKLLKRELAQLDTKKQILIWLKQENENRKNNSSIISASLTELSWKNLKKCIRNAFLIEKPQNLTKWTRLKMSGERKLVRSKSGLRMVSVDDRRRSPFELSEPQWDIDKQVNLDENDSFRHFLVDFKLFLFTVYALRQMWRDLRLPNETTPLSTMWTYFLRSLLRRENRSSSNVFPRPSSNVRFLCQRSNVSFEENDEKFDFLICRLSSDHRFIVFDGEIKHEPLSVSCIKKSQILRQFEGQNVGMTSGVEIVYLDPNDQLRELKFLTNPLTTDKSIAWLTSLHKAIKFALEK
uniref:PH domain-containing protein n=1 Tax=Strigamia maritima TaxID=126957 RepID=T1JGQ0_STRMM